MQKSVTVCIKHILLAICILQRLLAQGKCFVKIEIKKNSTMITINSLCD